MTGASLCSIPLDSLMCFRNLKIKLHIATVSLQQARYFHSEVCKAKFGLRFLFSSTSNSSFSKNADPQNQHDPNFVV